MAERPLRQRPLRSLQKLRASLEKPRTTAKPARAKPPPATFAEAMRRDGTVPLAPSPGRVLPAKSNGAAKAPPAPSFQLDTRDGFIEGRRAGLPARTLARLSGPPEATLDLHRRDAASARRLLGEFLERERASGAQRVLVIMGKGRHSAGGFGVLRAEIGDWLASAPLSAHVLAFASARPELGGTGCVSILLAPSRARKR